MVGMEYVEHVIKSILAWAAIGALGFLVYEVKQLSKKYAISQKGIKAMLRRDLINRWKECRDSGYLMTSSEKDEWLNDWNTYNQLNGKNGYLDNARDKILDMDCTDI